MLGGLRCTLQKNLPYTILSSDQFSLEKIFNWTIVCLERHNDETFHVS